VFLGTYFVHDLWTHRNNGQIQSRERYRPGWNYQADRRGEKKSKVLEPKFQELFKKAKEEPITKPIKDIDLD